MSVRDTSKLAQMAVVVVTLGFVGCGDDIVTPLRVSIAVPAEIEFGDAPVDAEVSRDLTVQNDGAVPVDLLSVAVEGESADRLTVEAFDVERLPVDASASVTLRFRSPVPHGIDASILLVTSAGDARIAVVGRAVAPLRIEPSQVDFEERLVGSTSTRSVTLQNVSSEIVDVHFEGPEDDAFAVLDVEDTPERLTAGARREFRVVYTPHEAGTHRGTVSFATCDLPDCRASARLSGTGRATLDCTPNPATFATLDPGETTTTTVSCTNVFEEAITVAGWAIEEANAPFLAAASSSRILSPGDTLPIPVTLSPDETDAGRAVSAHLIVQLEGLPFPRVSLRAEVGRPGLVVVPNPLDLGLVGVGTEFPGEVLLENRGHRDVIVGGAAVEGGAGLRVERFPSLIPAGASLPMQVRWAPVEAGTLNARITLTTNMPDPTVRIDVVGTAEVLEGCAYQIDVPQIEFGSVPVFQHRVSYTALRSTGTGPCLVRQPRVLGPATFRAMSERDASWLLAPGDALLQRVEFFAESAGPIQGEFALYVSAPGRSSVEVELTAFAESTVPIVGTTMLDFGAHRASCGTSTRSVTFDSTQSEPLAIETVDIVGPDADRFRLVSLAPESLPPRGSWTGTISVDASDLDQIALGFLRIHHAAAERPRYVPLLVEARSGPVEDVYTPDPDAKLDILLIVKTELSPAPFDLAAEVWNPELRAFVEGLESSSLDYQVGITSLHLNRRRFPFYSVSDCTRTPGGTPLGGQPSGHCGFLRSNPQGAPTLIRPNSSPSPVAVLDTLLPTENVWGHHRLMTGVAHEALEPPRILGWNAGLRRRDAELLIVALVEGGDYRPLSPNEEFGVFQLVGDAQRWRLQVSALTDDDHCNGFYPNGAQVSADPVPRVRDLALRSGGHVYSLCFESDSFGRRILEDGIPLVGHRRRYPARQRVASGTMEVIVDGAVIPASDVNGEIWSYDAELPGVTFARGRHPRPTTELRLRYEGVCD